MLRVVDVFDSIQGEGPEMGKWCTFVRLHGCNLSCPWCDEPTHKEHNWEDVEVEELVDSIHTHHVVVTGGEPTLQKSGLAEFIRCCEGKGIEVDLESNGTASDEVYEELRRAGLKRCIISPKAEAGFKMPDPKYIDALKYVVDDAFWEWAQCAERMEMDNVYLQPCDSDRIEQSYERILKLCERFPNVRAGVQLHKVYGAR